MAATKFNSRLAATAEGQPVDPPCQRGDVITDEMLVDAYVAYAHCKLTSQPVAMPVSEHPHVGAYAFEQEALEKQAPSGASDDDIVGGA